MTNASDKSWGLTADIVAGDDWDHCQEIAGAAHFLAFGGVVAPSATGVGVVIAVFEGRFRPDQVRFISTEPLQLGPA